MKRLIAFFFFLTLLSACGDEPDPECELPEFTFQEDVSQTSHVRDNGKTYERWCGDTMVREIAATEAAMKDEGCELGLEVEGRWECQAGFSTSYHEQLTICECAKPEGLVR